MWQVDHKGGCKQHYSCWQSETIEIDEGEYYLLLALVNGSTDTTSPNEADEEPSCRVSVDGQGDDLITMDAGRPQRKQKRTVNQEFLFY